MLVVVSGNTTAGLNLFAEFEHQQNYGTFKKLQSNQGELASENTLTFGLSVLF